MTLIIPQLRGAGHFKRLPAGAYARVEEMVAFLSTPFALLTDADSKGEHKGLAGAELRGRQLSMAGWQVRQVSGPAWEVAKNAGQDAVEDIVKGLLRLRYYPRLMRGDDA